MRPQSTGKEKKLSTQGFQIPPCITPQKQFVRTQRFCTSATQHTEYLDVMDDDTDKRLTEFITNAEWLEHMCSLVEDFSSQVLAQDPEAPNLAEVKRLSLKLKRSATAYKRNLEARVAVIRRRS